MPISWLDIILVTIMLISGLLAMVRGFTREVLSIFSWAVAAVAALYFTPKYWQVVQPYFPSQMSAQVVFGAGVFIAVLIVVSLITLRVSDRVLDSRVGAFDRTLGFIFGLARGFLLVAIVFVIFSALAKVQPEWIRDARSYPILEQTQIAIESLIPQNPEEHLPGQSSEDQSNPSTPPAEGTGSKTAPGTAPASPPDTAPASPQDTAPASPPNTAPASPSGKAQ